MPYRSRVHFSLGLFAALFPLLAGIGPVQGAAEGAPAAPLCVMTFNLRLVNEEGFRDTWPAARERRGEIVNTFHNFRGPTAGDNRIDWILARGAVETDATQIITCSANGQ